MGMVALGQRAFCASQRLIAAPKGRGPLAPSALERVSIDHVPHNEVKLVGVLANEPQAMIVQAKNLFTFDLTMTSSFTQSPQGEVVKVEYVSQDCMLRAGDKAYVEGELRILRTPALGTGSTFSVFIAASRVAVAGPSHEVMAAVQPTSYGAHGGGGAPDGPVPVDAEGKWALLRDGRENFWDNREKKLNPKAPDFKHKRLDVALWTSDRQLPAWVPSFLHEWDVSVGRAAPQAPRPVPQAQYASPDQLQYNAPQQYDAPQQYGQPSANPSYGGGQGIMSKDDMWRSVADNPDAWFDNRLNKRNPKAPDFKKKGKDVDMAVWLSDRYLPTWVLEWADKNPPR